MEEAEIRERLLDAALPHVPFDGWSEATLKAAITDSGLSEGLVRAIFPRGGVDLALEFHRRGDRQMIRNLASRDLSALKYREWVAEAVMERLAVSDREAVRRGTALLALPQHAAEGARALWGTADAIWSALGDTSEDASWYSKRATLSAVHGATVLYWLGDDSPGVEATRAFLDRRIEGVMRFEKIKAAVAENPLGRIALAGPKRLLAHLHAPRSVQDLPGRNRN